jgi:hypothetical protein
MVEHYVARPVTTITDKNGESYKTAIGNIELPDNIEDSSNVEVGLRSHMNKKIIVTAGAILTAATAVAIVRNRNQRRKMPKNASSFIRTPRNKSRLPGTRK